MPGCSGEETDTGVQIPGRYGLGAANLGDAAKEPRHQMPVTLKKRTDRNAERDREAHGDLMRTPSQLDLAAISQAMSAIDRSLEKAGCRHARRGDLGWAARCRSQRNDAPRGIEALQPVDVYGMRAANAEGLAKRR
jgi:hypothetical protein